MIEAEAANHTMSENIQKAVNVIIRPPRANYDIKSIGNFFIRGSEKPIPRVPISFQNRNNLTIVGSLYVNSAFNSEKNHKCVVYLHGNIGSQIEGRFLVKYLVPRGICLFCFDFSGSGLSGGEYVTLGYTETDDLIDTLKFLERSFQCNEFVLWGRSMGAACAVMGAVRNKSINGIIVDSSYTSLSELFEALSAQTPIPSLLRGIACWYIKRQVYETAGFDCNQVAPIEAAEVSKVPLLLGHAIDDDFVPYAQGKQLFESYCGEDKEMVTFHGGHNGARDHDWTVKCIKFILRNFKLPIDPVDSETTQETIQHLENIRGVFSTPPSQPPSANLVS